MKEYRQSWNQEEDQQLQELYKVYGDKWKKIAEQLHLRKISQGKMRTAAACRERYQNILKPSLSKKEWTREEEEKLFSLQKIYRNCWTKITVKMRNRSELICKNYFYATIRRVLRRLSKQVGILKPSQMLKSIKPSVLMSIYLEGNQESSMVFTKEIRLQLNQLITKYQFIQKDENIKMDNEEIQNIKQLIQELVDANNLYLEHKGGIQIQKKTNINELINRQFQTVQQQERIVKRIKLQKKVFVIRKRNFKGQLQEKEQILNNSILNEKNCSQKPLINQSSQIPENQFQTQKCQYQYQSQPYFQNLLNCFQFVSNYQQQYENLFNPNFYFQNHLFQNPFQFQLRYWL